MTIKTEKRTMKLEMKEWNGNGYGPDFLADLLDIGPEVEMTEEELQDTIEWCERYAEDNRNGVSTNPDYEIDEKREYYFFSEEI